MSEQAFRKCPFNGCEREATTKFTKGRITALMCEHHANGGGPIIEPIKLQKATTGDGEVDRMINQAVDMALLRLKPIIRDVIREELKGIIQLVEGDNAA